MQKHVIEAKMSYNIVFTFMYYLKQYNYLSISIGLNIFWSVVYKGIVLRSFIEQALKKNKYIYI